jgi:hypothetical protein
MGIFNLRSQQAELTESRADAFSALAHRIAAGEEPTASEVATVLRDANKSVDSLAKLAETIARRMSDHELVDDGAGTDEALTDVDAKLAKIDETYTTAVNAAAAKRDTATSPISAERDELLSRQREGVAARQRLIESAFDPAIAAENDKLMAKRAAIRGARSKLAAQERGIRATGVWPLAGASTGGSVVLEQLDAAGKAIAPAPRAISAAGKKRLAELEQEDVVLSDEEASIARRRQELVEESLIP